MTLTPKLYAALKLHFRKESIAALVAGVVVVALCVEFEKERFRYFFMTVVASSLCLGQEHLGAAHKGP